MSASLLLASLWALAATVTAFLPYRWQFPPGILLLLAAPALIAYIGVEHGVTVGLLALAGFVSMFRRPLAYLGRKLLRRGREEE